MPAGSARRPFFLKTVRPPAACETGAAAGARRPMRRRIPADDPVRACRTGAPAFAATCRVIRVAGGVHRATPRRAPAPPAGARSRTGGLHPGRRGLPQRLHGPPAALGVGGVSSRLAEAPPADGPLRVQVLGAAGRVRFLFGDAAYPVDGVAAPSCRACVTVPPCLTV